MSYRPLDVALTEVCVYRGYEDAVVALGLLSQLCDDRLRLGHVARTADLNETGSPTDVGQVRSEAVRVVLDQGQTPQEQQGHVSI